MEITHRTRGSTTIIRMCGRWVCGYDMRSDLRVHVQRLIEVERFDVVLELGGVTFIDSTVVGEIAWTHVALHRRGGRLTLLNPTRRMSRLLSISRLASVIEIRRSGNASAGSSAGPTRAITRGVDAASQVPVWSTLE